MRTDRLLKLADFLENVVPDDQFNIDHWTSVKPKGDHLTVGCGTAGCAIGWCPTIWPDDWELSSVGSPCLRGHRDWGWAEESIKDFFGLTGQKIDHLFYRESYAVPEVTRHDVAARIRETVANYVAAL